MISVRVYSTIVQCTLYIHTVYMYSLIDFVDEENSTRQTSARTVNTVQQNTLIGQFIQVLIVS